MLLIAGMAEGISIGSCDYFDLTSAPAYGWRRPSDPLPCTREWDPMRGRKPLPSNVVRLRGNPGKRRLNEAEPRPVARLPPVPPASARKPGRSGSGCPRSWRGSVC